MIITKHSNCRICGYHKLLNIIDLGEHNLHGSFCFPDYEPPKRRVPVRLMRCTVCGLVQLQHSIDPDILYNRYGYASGINPKMVAHLKSVVDKALSLVAAPTAVLDIAQNDGTLLRNYPDSVTKFGVDPSDAVEKSKDIPNLTTINECFPTKKLVDKFDIVSALAVMYDSNSPIEFAQGITDRLDKHGVAVVEVSYWPAKMAKNALDEICNEHVAFYNYQNLETIFKKVGLKIFDVSLNDINGGSIQVWLSHEECSKYPVNKEAIFQIKKAEMDAELDTHRPYEIFANNCEKMKLAVKGIFSNFYTTGKTCHLLAASTKTNVLLSYFGLNDVEIPYASERSPEKWGGTTLGSNIKMISEADSRAMNPDYYLVGIWSFKDAVIEREKEYLDKGGKLLFVLPEISIVSKETLNQ